MSDSTALILAGISVGLIIAVVIAFWVIYILAFWKMFQKAGEKGWKSIIPIYNNYILYKISWKGSMFWVMLIASIIGASLVAASGGNIDAGIAGAGWMYYVGAAFYLVTGVIYIMQNYKTSKAFGHGVGFCLGLIFFNFIFMLIIGFGSSQYKGAQE